MVIAGVIKYLCGQGPWMGAKGFLNSNINLAFQTLVLKGIQEDEISTPAIFIEVLGQ